MKKSRNRKANRQQEQKEALPKRSILADAFDIPQGVLAEPSQISLSGNREAVIEGCTGVLEYDNSMVKLNLGKMMIQFTGRNLQIRCMTGESVIVDGFITGLAFLT